jgi:protein involved in sex pheromone biosynthesis
MSTMKRVLIVAIVALAMLSVAGCLGPSDKDRAQEKYDNTITEANSQITVVANISDQHRLYSMTEPETKAWLTKYRSQIAVLQDDVNATNAAEVDLKSYLSPSSGNYATMTSNEASLKQIVQQYVSDYNNSANGYNSHWGQEHGVVPLL